MNNPVRVWGVVVFGIFSLAAAEEKETARSGDFITSAKRFLGLLEQGDFSSAVKDFDDTMTKVMPPEKLEKVWTSLVAQAGPFKRQVSAQAAKVPKFDIVVVNISGNPTLDGIIGIGASIVCAALGIILLLLGRHVWRGFTYLVNLPFEKIRERRQQRTLQRTGQ